MKPYTVVLTYLTSEGTAKLFYNYVRARSATVAVAMVAADCMTPPDDALVFPGEITDLHTEGDI